MEGYIGPLVTTGYPEELPLGCLIIDNLSFAIHFKALKGVMVSRMTQCSLVCMRPLRSVKGHDCSDPD